MRVISRGDIMSKNYAYYEKRYPNTIILRKEGYFFNVRNDSAIVMSNMFSLNLITSSKGTYRTGIPEYIIDKYLDDIELLHVHYVVISGEKICYRKDYLDNNFENYLIYPNETKSTEKTVEKSIKVGDKVTIKLMETGEIFTYKVLPKYFKYEYQGMGGSYYGASIRRIDDSDANISEGTINIDAPIIKALTGINEEEYFEVKVEGDSTSYQLLSLKNIDEHNISKKAKVKYEPENGEKIKQITQINYKKKEEEVKEKETEIKTEEKIEENIEVKYGEKNEGQKKDGFIRNYISEMESVRDLQLKVNCELFRVDNLQIKNLLNKYSDNVIIFVNGYVKIKTEYGKIYYVIQYREHKKYFEGSLTTRSINQAILWGIIHAVKRINKKVDVVLVMPVVYGFKSSLRGEGPNANLAIDMYETLIKQKCSLTIIEWYKGSKIIKNYIQDTNHRL